MCGFAGILTPNPQELEARAIAMRDAIRHRGPDDAGLWCDPAAGIALGHRRLSILDLTAAGHQPMASVSGRWVIAFNGEIYNYQDLRQALEAEGKAPPWRGGSDTEVLLAGIDAWGLEGCLRRAIGMFALVLWDRQDRSLSLARDRMGEKSLYYGWQGGSFLFGSELRALTAHPACQREVDRDALVHYLRHGHVGEGMSIYQGLRKLPPASIATVSLSARELKIQKYWSLEALSAAPSSFSGASQLDQLDAFEGLLQDAVRRQMVADVPLGAFLSGGIDSALVVALMQQQSARPVKTFSMGFHEKRYDEAPEAAAIARHLGTDHHEVYVDDAALRDAVPRMAEIYDEPFADPSQIPTWLVCRIAREEVTVALTGDGGDEFFGGYDRYRQGRALARKRAKLGAAAGIGARLVGMVPRDIWDGLLAPLRKVESGKEPNGQWAHRMGDYLGARDVDALHRLLVSRWRQPESGVLNGHEPASLLAERAPPMDAHRGAAERMMLLDQLTYLPDDLLTKIDRAAMAVGLETRAPLLDHRVAEVSWHLSEAVKLGHLGSKTPLKQVLYRHVPREMMERPKKGFEVPIAAWLRGPLRDWAADLLQRDRIAREGWFAPDLIQRLWRDHLSGKANHGLALWNVLMFQAWFERETAAVTSVVPLMRRG